LTNKVYVVYPKEIIPKEENEKSTMMFAGKEWEGSEIDFADVENSLTSILTIFENLEKISPKYGIGEAKLSVGLTVDEAGNIKAGIAANFLNILKGKVETEFQEGNRKNTLLEITIKRIRPKL
jgi:hypothetical protein